MTNNEVIRNALEMYLKSIDSAIGQAQQQAMDRDGIDSFPQDRKSGWWDTIKELREFRKQVDALHKAKSKECWDAILPK